LLVSAAIAMIAVTSAFGIDQLSIRSLKIVGVRKVSKSDILKVISTNAPSLVSFLPYVRLPGFDKGVLNDDMGRIVNLYQSYGYYHAQARYVLDTDAKRKRVRITIIVDEGKPTLVNNVTVNIVSGEAQVLRPMIGALVLPRQGEIFRIELYDKTKEHMDTFLGNSGYSGPSITGKVTVDKQHYRADIVFTVTTGQLQCFGPVSLEGNSVVRKRDILREVTFKEGAKFSRSSLFSTQRNIYRLNLFNSVVLTPDTEKGNSVPVDIHVDEKDRRTLSLGLGYGNEDKVRAQATWSRRYLWGSPRTLTFNARYSSLLVSGTADLTQLYFIDRFSSLGIHAGYDREYFVSYSDERIGTQARLGRTFGHNIESFAAYNLEIDRPVSVSQSTIVQLTDTQPGNYYFISGLMFGIRYDTVKDNLYPLYGSMFSLFFEPASFLLGSGVDYLRVIGEGRIFFPVVDGNILAMRLKVGRITPVRNTTVIPIFKRFFSGGSNSIRGYAFQSLGPTDSAGSPIGGDNLVEGNIESRFPVYGDIKGVIFLDGGNVFANGFDFSPSALKYSTGVGARYSTIVGPIRVDLAFPLDPFPVLTWSRYTVYLSLGNAF
jgi:outer membrane protein insertion porin family/translocation and assembly module TamA